CRSNAIRRHLLWLHRVDKKLVGKSARQEDIRHHALTWRLVAGSGIQSASRCSSLFGANRIWASSRHSLVRVPVFNAIWLHLVLLDEPSIPLARESARFPLAEGLALSSSCTRSELMRPETVASHRPASRRRA